MRYTMKALLYFLLIPYFVLAIFTQAAYANNTKKSKIIKIALGFDKPPFMFSKGTKAGIEADLIKEIFFNMGYKIQIVQKPKNYLMKALHEKNDIDVVGTISRQNDGLFYSDTFTTYNNVVVTRKKDNIHITSFEDLASVNFVIWKGGYADLGEKFYKYFNPLNGIYKNSYHDTISQERDALLFFSKKVDATIVDKTIFNWYKSYFNVKEEFVFHNIFNTTKTYPMTFRSKKLRDKFNRALRKIKKSKRYDEVVRFYENENIEEFLTYTHLLSDISAKFLFEKKFDQLKSLLTEMIIHPDILGIKITDNNTTLVDIEKSKIPQNIYTPRFERDIVFANGNKTVKLGKISIFYKKDYSSKRAQLIPDMKSVLLLPLDLDEESLHYIKRIYKKFGLDTKKLFLTVFEKQYIADHPVITVGNEKNWAPYNFNENGVPKGFVIDLISLLAKKIGLKIKYIDKSSRGELLRLIKEERIDTLPNIVKTPSREKYINFTKPYIYSKNAIFSNGKRYDSLEDLNTKTVAIADGFAIEEFLKKNYPKIKIKTYKDTKACLIALVNKEVDALIGNYSAVNYLIGKNGLTIKYVTIDKGGRLSFPVAIATGKSQKILRDIFQKALNNIGSMRLEKLQNKWFGSTIANMNKLTKEEKEYIKKKKTIKICVDPDRSPVEFLNKHRQPSGICVDTVKFIIKKTSLKPVFIPTLSWEASQEYLKQKRCDIIPCALKTKKRERYADFTKPYLAYKLAIITEKEKPPVNGVSDLVDRVFLINKAAGIIPYLREKYPHINIVQTKNTQEIFSRLSKGEGYWTLSPLPVFLYNTKMLAIENLQVAGHGDIPYKLSIAVRNDDKTLLSILNKTLKTIPQESFKLISDKWAMQKIIERIDWTLLKQVVFFFVIIIAIILIAYRKQQKLKLQIIEMNKNLERRIKEEVEANREKEDLMLRQSKLAQMGEMINMIAHQWRQPLNNLSLLTQTIVLKYNLGKLDNEAIEEFSDKTSRQIKMMSDTIDDFRNFFKPDKERVEFCINDVIEHIVTIIEPIFTQKGIAIHFDTSEKFYTFGYPNEFGQVVLNILNNAKDAFEEKNVEKKTIDIQLDRSNDVVTVNISDNAGGIPQEIIKKIFDPYFSTKEKKGGTGIGLYMSKIIIEEHLKGKLRVANTDKGAIFSITLPATQ